MTLFHADVQDDIAVFEPGAFKELIAEHGGGQFFAFHGYGEVIALSVGWGIGLLSISVEGEA